MISYFPSPEYDVFKFKSFSSMSFQLLFPFISLEISQKQESSETTGFKSKLIVLRRGKNIANRKTKQIEQMQIT